ncbi:MAG: hypothetical protein QOD84_2807 [Acidobacteriaceae bacterium]|jgi:hypothetical protein
MLRRELVSLLHTQPDRKRISYLASEAKNKTDFVNLVAAEMAAGIECAVDSWLARIDRVLKDNRLTTLGRLYAIEEVVQNYKNLVGKKHFTSAA